MKRSYSVLVLALMAAGAAVASLSLAAETGWQKTFGEEKANLGPTGRNPYFILEPGYVLHLEGLDDGKKGELVISVLDETKTIDGVETRVVEERESRDGKLVEVSRNFFAISKATSNVYYFGEESFSYKTGKPVKAGDSWMSGVDGATYGLAMHGKPAVGMKFYQEQAPKVAMDRAEITSLSENAVVPAKKFERCLKVEETTPLEPGEKEYKLYAEGVGLLTDEDLKLVRYGFEKK